ncbi:hypothetical protein, partial [Flavobacterium sp. W21_SRS_FM7]
GITATMVGLANVDNTTDANKPVSTATQTALDLKVDKAAGKGLSTEDYSLAEKTKLAAISGTNTGDQDLSSYATTANLEAKANLASPTFTGTVTGITASMVGLANVDNTTDANKPVSTATQTALDLKASLASPVLTGTPAAPTAPTETNTTQIATTAFVNSFVSSATSGVFVDVTTAQVIAGVKSFSSDVIANGIKVGKGVGNGDSNVALGTDLGSGTGYRNTGIGSGALNSYSGTSFGNNTGVGYNSMVGLTSGYGNTSIGAETMFNIAGNDNNTAIGNQTLMNSAASNNTAIGANAGGSTTGSGNTFVGQGATVSDGTFSNTTAVGYQASVTANNTIQLGNLSVTDVKTSGNITAASYIKSGGTSLQYLMADGSVSSGSGQVRDVTDEFLATASQTTFTLAQAPSSNSKVKMYVNGIRISNTAYSVSNTTLTYNPTNNGSYALSLNDRIQFDYFY